MYKDMRDFRGRRTAGNHERAITNMIVTSDTNVSSLTNGTAAASIRRKSHWKMSPLLTLGEKLVVDQGYQNARASWLAHYAVTSVAAYATNAAINPTAIGSNIGTGASTLAPFGMGIAISSEVANQTADFNRLKDLLYRMAPETIMDYMSHGATNGAAALASSMTAITTSAGGKLKWSSVKEGALAIRQLIGADFELVFVTDSKGVKDISDDMDTSSAGMYANQALTGYVKTLFVEGALPNEVSFTGIVRDGVSVFVVNAGSAGLYTNGGNTYGMLMVPSPNGDDVDSPMGSIAIAGYADPSAERRVHEVVESINGVGISAFDVDPASGEDGSQRFWRVAFDAFLLDTDSCRAVTYSTT